MPPIAPKGRAGRAARACVPVVVLVALAACAEPTAGSPAEAYTRVLAGLEAGDRKAVFALLAEPIQADVTRLHALLTESLPMIDADYPPSQRTAAREALGAALLEGVDGPAALFDRLAAPREAVTLGTWQRLGARVRQTVVDGATAKVTTIAGDVYELRQASDGSWRWVPPEEDWTAVREVLARAEANRKRLDEGRERVRQLREKGVVRPLPADAVPPAPPPVPAPSAAPAAAAAAAAPAAAPVPPAP